MAHSVGGQVRVVLFATARQAVGAGEITWEVPTEGITVGELIEGLTSRYPHLRPIVAHSRLLCNGEYLPRRSVRLRAGDEFAVHPPYSGG
ncbi:MAG TPA: MoaD/ThiS family protein [Thermoplasmata archaeon]|nr:MoaD/ThiS family protein [Thermoplasmata archaeon]